MKLASIGALAFFALWLAGPARAASPATQTSASSFNSAGVKIAYIEAGKGEPVILVHGLYSSAELNWVAPGIFKQLAQKYHVIALDLRGHGNSDKPAPDDAYGQPMVEDITRLMDHLKIDKAHIVGYSLGGIIAMKFVVDHADHVLSANLGGMGWLREGSFQQTAFELLGGRDASGTPPACVHGIAKLAVTEAQVKTIKVPLEMLVGDRDPCRRLYVEPLAKVSPTVPVIVIDGAGHLTCVTKDQYKSELGKWIDKNAK